jgi:hypothetical protein
MKAPFTTKADETPEFVEFWNVWRPTARHTDGRGEARDAFFKHVNAFGADPRDIVEGAKYFIRTMKERDKEFVPLAASWLNKRAYEDLAEAERTLNERIAQRQQQGNVVPMNVVLPKNHFQNRA